ncbi:hypothetical protein VNO77_03339 [Canavalia gladiata]|uniref:Uncharacterized protein n=1 Tax=Canavalia gladiata TaxID=3824 RepID=A0AAN9MUP7_CANGL
MVWDLIQSPFWEVVACIVACVNGVKQAFPHYRRLDGGVIYAASNKTWGEETPLSGGENSRLGERDEDGGSITVGGVPCIRLHSPLHRRKDS